VVAPTPDSASANANANANANAPRQAQDYGEYDDVHAGVDSYDSDDGGQRPPKRYVLVLVAVADKCLNSSSLLVMLSF
jgi:hypothetical protein